MKSQDLVKKQLPSTPGVYFWLGEKRKSGGKEGRDILYIGKATSLRSRVRSYFSPDLIKTRGPGIVDMVFKSADIAWEETETVLEALILEAELIKKYQPKYNVREKDNKSFNFVVITEETFPKVLLMRGRTLKFKEEIKNLKIKCVFGPFTSGGMLKEALRIIRRIFPFQDGSSAKKDNYVFYRQLGLTPDISNEAAKKLYQKNIRHILLFFKGKKKKIVEELTKEMKKAAKEMRFEYAGELKRQIFALTHINDIALMKYESTEGHMEIAGVFRIEAYDVAHLSGSAMVGVMTVATNNIVDKAEYRKFIIRSVSKSNDTGALEEMLQRRLRHTEWGLPDLIVVDGNEVQRAVAIRVLKNYQLAIPVVAVIKDERHKPKALLGEEDFAKRYKRTILLLNAEAHRFAVTFHKNKRAKQFIAKSKK